MWVNIPAYNWIKWLRIDSMVFNTLDDYFVRCKIVNVTL